MKLIRPLRKYTEQDRAAARALREKGYSVKEIAKKQGIPPSTVFVWLNPDKQAKYYKRAITPQRKAYLIEYQRKWVTERKKDFLSDKACEICGEKKHLIVSGTSRKNHIGKLVHSFYSLSTQKQKELMPKIHIFCRFHAKRRGNSKKESERVQKLTPIIKKQWSRALF
ncbi:MAG TPA: helix-turn-helix domain-containing protein [Candidatus Babeliaceae bacterium]|nr:helix-turn-helix domain-containing protein [Candidatus Babeliaceae bacterium]